MLQVRIMTSSQQVRQIPAQKAQDATTDCWHIKHEVAPTSIFRTAKLQSSQLLERWAHDERQHEQHIGVKGEPDGSNDTDEPLHVR